AAAADVATAVAVERIGRGVDAQLVAAGETAGAELARGHVAAGDAGAGARAQLVARAIAVAGALDAGVPGRIAHLVRRHAAVAGAERDALGVRLAAAVAGQRVRIAVVIEAAVVVLRQAGHAMAGARAA